MSAVNLGTYQLEIPEVGKDLGVNHRMIRGHQYDAGMKRANAIIGYIRWGIMIKDRKVLISSYEALMWSYLEHNVQFWSPIFQNDRRDLKRTSNPS